MDFQVSETILSDTDVTICHNPYNILGFPVDSDSKESAYNAGNLGLIPGLGRSPEERNGYPSSILAQRIPWKDEPGVMQSMGSQRVRRD